MLNIRDRSTAVLVLRSVSHGGLNIIRSLGPLGVGVYNLDSDWACPASFSRYCRGRFVWDIDGRPPDDTLNYLSEVRRRIGRPTLLIPTTDRTARFVASHESALREWFIFPKQRPELVHVLCSKKEMHGLAKHHGVPTPETALPTCRNDVVAFVKNATFPIMLKGIDGQRLWDHTGKKMFIVRTERELLHLYDWAEDPANPNLVLQEYIPGSDDTVWMFNGYFNECSECLVGFTGKKIRQCPIHTGSTSLGVCLPNEAVDTTTRTFMKAIGYRGILDIGYRFDARDGQYKVLDINPRIGATFRLFEGDHGMDVCRAMYLDLTGQPVPPSALVEGRRWMVEDLDLVSSFRYILEGSLTVKQWAKSLRGIDEYAFLDGRDPLPVISMVVNRTQELFRRICRWARGRFASAKCPGKEAARFPASVAREERLVRSNR